MNYEEVINANREKFEAFRKILLEYNDKFNLTAITDEKETYYKHFLDSVVGEKYIKNGASVAEIGSGGGFPSIPLKLVRDDLSFTLIESSHKKCGYLEEVVDRLKLNFVKVISERAEIAAKQVIHREKYDVCEARAVARLNTLAEYCMPFVKKGGRFIAYKGDCEEEIKQAEHAIKLLGGEIETVDEYEINGEKRTLVVVKKIAPTPMKYPRGQGKERKSPLM